MIKAVKFQLADVKKPVLIYYLVMVLVLGLFFTVSFLWPNGEYEYSQFGALEMVSAIFLFVIGLNSFKDSFHMFLQNGISRKTMLKAQVVTGAAVTLILTCFDGVLEMISRAIAGLGYHISIQSLFEQLYQQQKPGFLTDFIMTWLLYMVLYSAGFFLTLLYYRMNKALKIIVSIGFFAVPFIIMPLLDTLFHGKIYEAGGKLISLALGMSGGPAAAGGISFIMPVLFSLAFTAIAWGLSFLLIRRAVAKRQ